MSSWIDGSSIYGQSQVWANCLRAFKGGRLRTGGDSAKFPALNKLGLPFHNYPDASHVKRNLDELWSMIYTHNNNMYFESFYNFSDRF